MNGCHGKRRVSDVHKSVYRKETEASDACHGSFSNATPSRGDQPIGLFKRSSQSSLAHHACYPSADGLVGDPGRRQLNQPWTIC